MSELLGPGLILVIFGAWLTHVMTCLSTSAWGFLVAGALLFPIGVIHGFGIWCGLW